MNSRPAIQPSAKLQTSVLSSEAEFNALACEWDQLLDESDQCVFFLRWAWNRLWWRFFSPTGSRLFLMTCRNESGRLVGLAPFYWRRRRTAGLPHVREVLFLGTGVFAQTSEYLDIVAARGLEEEVARALAECLERRRDWDRLWLNDIPCESVTLSHFRRALGDGIHVEVCNRVYQVPATGDWESYLDGLSKSMRRHVTRQTRRMFELHDCKFTRVETEDELDPAIDALVRLHQLRWQARGEPGAFALRGAESFVREGARFSLRDGRLRLWKLEVNGEIAAVRLGFLDNAVVHTLQAGFDPAYSKESAGTVMIALCLRDAIEDEQVSWYDFMGGSDSHKETWNPVARQNICLTWLRPGVRSRFLKEIERLAIGSKSVARSVAPRSFWRAAHQMMIKRHYQASQQRESQVPNSDL